jgi:hypothetical protein
MTSERVDGPTPNGGDYALATSTLATWQEVDKAHADGIVISEYTEDGAMIFEMVGMIGPSA